MNKLKKPEYIVLFVITLLVLLVLSIYLLGNKQTDQDSNIENSSQSSQDNSGLVEQPDLPNVDFSLASLLHNIPEG